MSEISISHLEVTKLELQRGDILIVKLPPGTDSGTSKHAHTIMSEALRRANIDGVQLVMGTVGDEFSIIRKDAP